MSIDKEYTCIVELPHTCEDNEWDQEENPCVACKNDEVNERSIDVKN